MDQVIHRKEEIQKNDTEKVPQNALRTKWHTEKEVIQNRRDTGNGPQDVNIDHVMYSRDTLIKGIQKKPL